MSSPYVGEIRMFGGTFAPAGWAFCDGQLLPISENEALFMLIGTTYGGDGESTFALPDLRGRLALHQGNGYPVGQAAGVEQVTLTVAQVPAHRHTVLGSSNTASATSPANAVPATFAEVTTFGYGSDAPTTTLHPAAVGAAGGNQPHGNLQPFLCVNFIISLFGIFPSQS